MEIPIPTKLRFRPNRSRTNIGTVEYSNSLQLYTLPPTETISLQEFEELAMDRLKGTINILPTYTFQYF